ncbi:hypothetical protein HK102_001938 [Quaeritorhiza haematococci]|nr:hypothetical protein HK102_001938 [Quaeritorhiza haematococci]
MVDWESFGVKSTPRPPMEVINDPRFYKPLLLSMALQLVVYYGNVYFLPRVFESDKARSWILTALSSFVMTLGSLPFVLGFFTNNFSLAFFPMLDGALPIALSAFFMTYLWGDLGLGSLHYRHLIHPMTGWFHHTLYTFVVFYLITWRLSGVFCILAVLEAPTLIMAAGAINKKWRRDFLFGGVFFVTRIVFHVFITYKIFSSFPGTYFYLISLGIFPLHVMWFHAWINQQIRLHKQRKKEALISKMPVKGVTTSTNTPTITINGTIKKAPTTSTSQPDLASITKDHLFASRNPKLAASLYASRSPYRALSQPELYSTTNEEEYDEEYDDTPTASSSGIRHKFRSGVTSARTSIRNAAHRMGERLRNSRLGGGLGLGSGTPILRTGRTAREYATSEESSLMGQPVFVS